MTKRQCLTGGCTISVRARRGDRNYSSHYCHKHFLHSPTPVALVLEVEAPTVTGMSRSKTAQCLFTGCDVELLDEMNIRARSCDQHLELFRYGHSLSCAAEELSAGEDIDLGGEHGSLSLGKTQVLPEAVCRTPDCLGARQDNSATCRQCSNIRSRTGVNRDLTRDWEAGLYSGRENVLNAWRLENAMFENDGTLISDQSMAAKMRAALRQGLLQPCTATTHTEVTRLLTTPELAYHHSHASRGRVNVYCQSPEGEHVYTTRLASLTDLYDRAMAGKVESRDRWRVCSQHRPGTGGYSRSVKGYLYLLRRPSMSGASRVLKDSKGRDLYDYQFGISNVPQKRLGHHIKKGGWEIVDVRVSDDGNDAHRAEAFFKEAVSLLDLRYWALDEKNQPMSGVTECFTQRDFGRRCGSLDSLAGFADRALKASGSTAGAVETLGRLSPADPLEFTPVDGRTGAPVKHAA